MSFNRAVLVKGDCMLLWGMGWIFVRRSLVKLMGLEFLRDFEGVEDVNLGV